MNLKRIAAHWMTPQWKISRAFPPQSFAAIEAAIQASETRHSGEVRFAVEAALDGMPLWKDQSARVRAIDVFSQLRMWDTERKNGVLIYVLLADRAVEIVCDRGIDARVGAQEWMRICRRMEEAFKEGRYEQGVLDGLEAITQHLVVHFPAREADRNELPNAPVVL